MKVYLVGGAVRDQLLGYPYSERDWVVVGATPEELIQKKFKQVGKDFPVFLHPKTNEEYALARTERKKGQGYYGFVCDFNQRVKLEDDLARRDITINAMAMDDNGKLFDPHGGQNDLSNKIIRHVSPAFSEDPVRVLRVARFLARYHHLGFKLASETRHLMLKMVLGGELRHLVPERIWTEWSRSLVEKNPEQFVLILRSCGALKEILPELDHLFGVPNPVSYHPEIDTGWQTIDALQAITSLTDDPVVRFAVTTHDLGKSRTCMSDWPSHPNHELVGEMMIKALCKRLRIPGSFCHFARLVCLHHLTIQRAKSLPPHTIVKTLDQTDAYRRPEQFEQLLLASQVDKFTRSNQSVAYDALNIWRQALKICEKVSVRPIVEQGYQGEAIRNELHRQRVEQLKLVFKESNEKK